MTSAFCLNVNIGPFQNLEAFSNWSKLKSVHETHMAPYPQSIPQLFCMCNVAEAGYGWTSRNVSNETIPCWYITPLVSTVKQNEYKI